MWGWGCGQEGGSTGENWYLILVTEMGISIIAPVKNTITFKNLKDIFTFIPLTIFWVQPDAFGLIIDSFR